MVTTVEANKIKYTDREISRADRARALYHAVGTPTPENFKAILRQNIIQNCPVTIEDFNLAEKIHGPDVSSLKGKSTRKRPCQAKEDFIEIPVEIKTRYQNLELCMDNMFIHKMPMLTSIDRTIRY